MTGTTFIERPLYGRVTLETTASTGTFSWVDRSSYMTSASYFEGVQDLLPGSDICDIGRLSASFRNLPSVPSVGDYVRLRRTGTSEYFFVGYIYDVEQRIIYDNNVALSTPVTLTTIYVNDWIGLLSQFVVNGVGGRTNLGVLTSSAYGMSGRVRAINYAIDPAGTTTFINPTAVNGGSVTDLNDTDMISTALDHMNLAALSSESWFYGAHVLPTNNTTGRTNLVLWDGVTAPSSGKTFTDVAGSAGQLHYVELDLTSSSSTIANTVQINNTSLVKFTDPDITKLAGANEENFIYVDGMTKVYGLLVNTATSYIDTTSVASYGTRSIELETNVDSPIAYVTSGGTNYYIHNLIANPSVEYGDEGYASGANVNARRRPPSGDPNPFTAYTGSWAMRARQTTAALNGTIKFLGGESDGIPVTAGNYYRFSFQGLRGTVSRTDMRCRAEITWYDDSETALSSSNGSFTTLTNANQWYNAEVFAVAPANAVRAQVNMFFNRSGGGNITVGDRLWADGLIMHRTNSTGTVQFAWFDGDSGKNTAAVNIWTGTVGNSQSVSLKNNMYNRAVSYAAAYANASIRATRIRWNAQEDLTAVSSLTVGKTISLVYKGATTTYRIIGIQGDITQERYMIDYYLWKV